MATIIEKEIKSGIQFQVRYRIGDKQRTKTFTSKNKKDTNVQKTLNEANKFKKSVEAELALGLVKNETNMNFYDCVWHVYKLKFQNLQEYTIDNYTIYINQVCEYFGKMKLRSITPIVVESFFTEKAKTKSKRLLKFYWSILKNTFEYAYKKEMISDNPMLKVDFVIPETTKKTKKIMPVNQTNINIFLNHLNNMPKYQFLVKLMLFTGMRVGEAQAITWSDINKKKKVISINKNFKRKHNVGDTKTKRNRIVVLHNSLLELLEEIQTYQSGNKKKFGKEYQDNNLIICNECGSYIKYSAIKSYFERLDKKMDDKIRSHRFRHTFASTLILNEGLNPKVVQKLLGHQKISTTMDIYTDLIDNEYDQHTYDSMDNAFSEKKEECTTNVQQI